MMYYTDIVRRNISHAFLWSGISLVKVGNMAVLSKIKHYFFIKFSKWIGVNIFFFCFPEREKFQIGVEVVSTT